MKRLGKLSAGILLGQSQLGREPSQLECSLFQLRMTSFQLRMTLAECLLSLFVHGAITFFLAARLEKVLGATTLRDIQIEAGKQHYMPFGIAVGLAPAFYP